MTPQPANYAEQLEKLEASVQDLSDQYEKDRSDETRKALHRRRDALLHVKNLSKGDPKARAEQAATSAREFVRKIAIA
jgi:hypothetical protein